MCVINIENSVGVIKADQKMYDSFNYFMFSNERNVFNKLHSKFWLYDMTKHLHGDIVECGVFKGSGLVSWLKIMNLHEPFSIKKVIGFDFFDPNFVDSIDLSVDKESMSQVFTRVKNFDRSDFDVESIREKITMAGFDDTKFELVRGDISLTSKEYLAKRPGFRISLLYLDLDLYEPTYNTLVNLWDNLVSGGVAVFDEYAYHTWSESDAVDQFLEEKKLKLVKTNIKAPTAYVIKP